MKQVMKILAFFLLSIYIPAGCKSSDRYNILVLHSYTKDSGNYKAYDWSLAKSLEKSGIKADIRNVFETGYAPSDVGHKCFIDELTLLKAENWAPDIICIEEDRTLDNYLRGVFDSLIIRKSGTPVPVVAAGLHCPDWNALKSRKEIAVLTDRIDLEENIRLAVDISGRNEIISQLNMSGYDLRLREMLSEAQRNGAFILDSGHSSRKDVSPDSIIVSLVSLKYPEQNESSIGGLLPIEDIILKTENMATLTLCRDLYDDQLVGSSLGLTFTAVRDAFRAGTAKRLCGYFASHKTVGKDQGKYAAQILKGANPADLPVLQHKQDYYMDWSAMKLFNMHSIKWLGQFHIVRAPFSKTHPMFLFLGFLLLVGLIILATWLLISQKEKDNSEKMTEKIVRLKTELEMFNLGLLGSGCKFLDKLSDVIELEKITHPDDISILYDLIHSIEQKEWTTDTCVRLTNDKGKTYRWWQIRTYNDEETDTFSAGIAIDIDDSIRHTEEMMYMEKVAKEVTKKESFMRNLSHEIRTPLNTIVGFSEFISENFNEISEEEKEEFGIEINKSTKALEQMIEVVLQYSRFESGRVKFNCKETNMGNLVEDIFDEWKMDNYKTGVEVVILRGEPDVFAFVDPERTKEILRQYLRNALKFTNDGIITIGWDMNSSKNIINMYVSDTGRGIEIKKQKFVFDLFWKEDPFTQGLGLGLTLAKMYTERMDGQVSMRSSLGEGSVFIVSFPCHSK